MRVLKHRPALSPDTLESCIGVMRKKLDERLKEKGEGAWLSTHEILGIVSEEFHELQHAVHENNRSQVYWELLDIAVACIFGMACLGEGTVDW